MYSVPSVGVSKFRQFYSALGKACERSVATRHEDGQNVQL